MKSFVNFRTPLRLILVLVFLSGFTGCIQQDDVSSAEPFVASGVSNDDSNPNAKSTSSASDYKINLTVDGCIWTYCITLCEGAKGVSNFSINLQNCGPSSSTIDDILWATVNGQPATLESSNGNNGCDIQSVTTNFVKFDNLPEASTYKIVFKLDRVFGNFIPSTVWLKAGTSCHSYTIIAPCCPL